MAREDLFTMIHKGLRSMLYDRGIELQVRDFTDTDTNGDFFSRLDYNFEIGNEHAMHEERHIFPEMRRYEQDLVSRLVRDHRRIEELRAEVMSAADGVEKSGSEDELIARGIEANQAFNDYLAYFLGHINFEEANVLPSTQEHFDDAELASMRASIMKDMSPEKNRESLRLMLPVSNNNELAETVRGIKASGMPPEAFEKMMSFARDILGEDRWRAVELKLGEEILA